MQRQSILSNRGSLSFGMNTDGQCDYGIPSSVFGLLPERNHVRLSILRRKLPCFAKSSGLEFVKVGRALCPSEMRSVADNKQGEISDEDDELCPAECVKEFKSDEEFSRILDKAKETGSLVVVDFYRTSCGSCKYIEQIFSKLCKGSGDEEAPVIFLKHNVIDEYDEPSEPAERLRIRAVPLFHFYKDGDLLEAFPTRDKERIVSAILKHTSPAPPDFELT